MRPSLDLRRPLLIFSLSLPLAPVGCGDDGAAETGASATAAETDASDSASGSASATATTTTTTATSDASATASATTSADTDSDSDTATTAATTAATDATATATDSTGASASESESGVDTDTDSDTDTTTTGGPGEPIAAEAPAWLRAVDGLSSLSPPQVAPLPDGDVVAILTGGLYAHEIVLADDDADEQVLAAMYTAPAFARFDGESGALKEGRMLAQLGQGTPFGMSVLPRQLELASDGDLLVLGTWTGTTEWFPGTADSATHITQMKLDGNQFHRAEDPFVFRMTPGGAIAWFVRGRTPAPLSTTWFNYGKGLAALPDGGLVIAGDYELTGFVVAANTAGAKTMSGAQRSYLARLGADGAPQWIFANSKQLAFTPLRSGADGALYGLLPPDATLFEGGPTLMTGSEPGLGTSVIARLDPAGGALWSARVAKAPPTGPVRGFEPTAGGDLLLFGNASGELLLRDADDAVMNLPLTPSQGWIAGLSAAGEGLYLRALGPAVDAVGPTLRGDDGVWIVARIAAPFELEVAGEVMPLPDLGQDPMSTLTALLRLDAAGDVASVQVVGASLPIASLRWSGPEQAAFLVTGAYWCDSTQPHVIAGGGGSLAALKHGCDMEPNDDQRGYVAAIPRAP